MKTAVYVCLTLSLAGVWGAEAENEPGAAATLAQKAEARKRQYEALQKDLEAARPAKESTNEEIIAFLELAMDSYGKFARENSKTVEGFEAASFLAELLNKTRHPKALEF